MAASRFAILAALLVVVASGSAGIAVAADARAPADDTPHCSITVRYHSVDSNDSAENSDELRLHVTCDVPRSVDRFRVVYAGDVVDRSGFDVSGSASGADWTRSTDSPSLVIAQRPADYPDVHVGRDYAITDGWAFVPKPAIEFVWSFEGSPRTYAHDPFDSIDSFRARFPYAASGDRINATVDLEGSGFVSDRALYLGGYAEHTADGGGQRLRLIVPHSATVPAGPDRIVRSLASASERLRIGGKDPEVLVFAAPDPLRMPTIRGWVRGYAYPGSGEVVVNDGMPLDAPRNTWLHEYVHTRQAFVPGPRMAWFVEASAEYYGQLLTYEQGRISATELHRSLRWQGLRTLTLSNASTWGRRPPYYKGSSVLYALDSEIRAETDGNATLLAVFRRLNARSGPITLADFKAAVEAVSGTSMDAWIDAYVTTTRSPDVRSADTFVGGFGTVKDVRIVDPVDLDGDGNYSDFDVRVRLDTAIEGTDPVSGDGEPVITVVAGNETVARTDEVDWSVSYEGTIRINASSLDRFAPGPLAVTVVLWDGDVGSDDRIAERTVIVDVEPEGRKRLTRTTSTAGYGDLRRSGGPYPR